MTVRVVVVDDSPTMRGLLTAMLNRDPEIEVVGSAGDPLEARDVIKRLNPDVITLDVEMPKMDGLSFLEKIMRLRPMPVLMVSTLTHKGAETALRALEIGAVDCIGKPTEAAVDDAFDDIAEKVKAAARARVRPRGDRPAASTASSGEFRPDGKMIAIGSSTGGVEALIEVISNFPANCPPTVITQHMPPTFTTSFAARLDRLCAPRVAEATDGAVLEVGAVYLAPGGDRHLEVSGKSRLVCRLVDAPPMTGHRPSVDMLFNSVAANAGPKAVGMILTGMGKDGAEGLLKMRRAGARTFGQDEATCVVYGMPKAAHDLGAVETQLPLERLGPRVLSACSALNREAS